MQTIAELVTTTVTFKSLSAAAIDAYLATDEPYDKAGAYAVQGQGGAFVSHVAGSWTNVVGLPREEVTVALRQAGLLSQQRTTRMS